MKNSAGNGRYVRKCSAQPRFRKRFLRHGKSSPPSEASAFDYAHSCRNERISIFKQRWSTCLFSGLSQEFWQMCLARGQGRELESRFQLEDQNVHEEENEANRAGKTRRKDQNLYYARPHSPEDSGNSEAD